MRSKAALAVLLATLLACYPVLNVSAAGLPLGKVVPGGSADLNGTRLTLETTLYSGDTVATAADGVAFVFLPKGDRLQLGPKSEVQLSSEGEVLIATLGRGAVQARSGNGGAIAVSAGGLVVDPGVAALYEVGIIGNTVFVSAQTGAVTVYGINQAVTVPAGKAMRFELAQAQPPPKPAPKPAPKAAPKKKPGGGWAGLSQNTKIAILAAIGGGAVVAIVLATGGEH